ncbi:MAG: HEAT repeat domain-containing protein [Lachnospiraceae bacterium]|nr:HEAT repeat domain-containing protein [Lachnospiraceae bacterium]
MIKELYEQICAGDEVRANLIRLRDELKNEENRREFAYLLGGDFSNLTALLKDEDPKVRKNAALILGKLESEDLLPVLFEAYKKEKTLFIRADYLKALSELDYRPLSESLEEQLSVLRENSEWTPEEWKHVSEEIRILQTMVLRCRGIRHHRFAGGKEKEDVILLTNRCQRAATAEQVQKGKITMLAGGLRVDGASLKEVRPIRTYSELLFPLKTRAELRADQPVLCGEMLAGPVLALADRLYNGAGAFLYRIDVRGQAAARTSAQDNSPSAGNGAVSDGANADWFCVGEYREKKGSYIRKLSTALERASGARLVNSVTDYEIELRLVLKKDGTFTAMLKPSSSFDERFIYRKEVVASSIAPVNAALTARLALPWLKEGAQVLDPFCGVGTMLIERDRAVKAGTMYGLDIFGEAIEKARRNTRRADCIVNYINRDFFTFRHEYLFDEVVTNMPVSAGDGSKQALRQLYHDFFVYVGGLLKEEAVLVIYTSAPNYVVESVRKTAGFRMEKSFLLNEKNQTTVFVVAWKRP